MEQKLNEVTMKGWGVREGGRVTIHNLKPYKKKSYLWGSNMNWESDGGIMTLTKEKSVLFPDIKEGDEPKEMEVIVRIK